MKSKVNVKSSYSIKKVNRVMRMKSEKFEPTAYEVYKVTGPNKVTKYFSSKKDATQYVKGLTNTKMNIIDAFTEIKRLENMKLPIKTI
jgi:hypothetical protein